MSEFLTLTTEQLQEALDMARRDYAGVARFKTPDPKKVSDVQVEVFGLGNSWSPVQLVAANGTHLPVEPARYGN